MYTIKMCNDKTLLTTYSVPFYQGEENADTIDFFIPQIYNNRDISNALVRLDYILPNGISGYKILDKDSGSYGDYNLYHFIVDASFTSIMGRIRAWLTLLEGTNNIILKSSETYFDIFERINITGNVSDVDQLMQMIQDVDAKKADNIIIDNDQNIQLESNGELIGDSIGINRVISLDE